MNDLPPRWVRRGFALLSLTGGLALAQSTCQLPQGPLPERSRYVVMLDVSGSMVGKGDGKFDIFRQVERELGRFLQDTASTSTVRLVTFAEGVQASRDFEYPEQKAELQTYLDALRPTGERTFLYRSMQKVFSGLRQDRTLATTVYVLTDGQDNDPQPVNLRNALATFEKSRGTFDKLYYIGLGTDIPQDAETAFDATSYARTLEVPPQIIPQLGGFGLLPALLELSQGKLTRSGKLGEDVRLSLDTSRFPGLTLDQDRLTRGEGRLTLTVDPARPGTPEAAALLCVEGTRLSERALVRPGRGAAAGGPGGAVAGSGGAGTGGPGAQTGTGPLRLDLLNPEANRTLAPGETTTLKYRLRGRAGRSGQVDFGPLPRRLEATVDGRPLRGPITVAAGESFALTLRNTGLPGGQVLQITPALDGEVAQAQRVSAAPPAGGAPTGGTRTTRGRPGGSPDAAALRLVLLNPQGSRTLTPGATATLRYRVQGPAGQAGLVEFGDLPAGLTATVNGQPLQGPLPVEGGDTLALTLLNRGLPDGGAVEIAPTLNGQAAQAQRVSATGANGNAAPGTPSAGTGTAAGSMSTPGAAEPLRLVLLNPEANRTLAPGEETTLNYQLRGPAGQSGRVDFGDPPEGLEATVNGQPLTGPLTVAAGDTVALTLRNTGLPVGEAVSLSPSVDDRAAAPQQVRGRAAPGGAAGGAGAAGGTAPTPTTGGTPGGTTATDPLRLVLLNLGANRTLAPGEETTLNYQLQGPAGQSGQVDFGTLPEGLEATVSGQAVTGPLTVAAGDTVALTLRNAGLPGGETVNLAPTLDGRAAQPVTVSAAPGTAGAGTTAAGGQTSDRQAPAAGRVVLLTPEAGQNLARGESTVLRYRAEGGAATVQLGAAPDGTRVTFEGQPGNTLTVPAGGEFGVRVTNTGLGTGQAVSPEVRAAGVPVNVPTLTGARAGFDGSLLGLLGLLGLLPLFLRRAAPQVRPPVPVGPAPVVPPPGVTAPSPHPRHAQQPCGHGDPGGRGARPAPAPRRTARGGQGAGEGRRGGGRQTG